MLNRKTIPSITASVLIFPLCFISLTRRGYFINNYPLSLRELLGNLIFIIPIVMFMNSFTDGLLFFRHKFNIVLGELWMIILCYIRCRLHIYRFMTDSISLAFYMQILAGAVVMITPIWVKDCDDSGIENVNINDYIWIAEYFALGIFLL